MSKRPESLSTAQSLFARHGLKKVTTDDIARDAHVSKATIYKLYRNKQEILQDVIRMEMEELMSRIQAAVDVETTVEGRLRAHLMTRIEAVHEFVHLHAITRRSFVDYWIPIQDLRDTYLARETGMLKETLRQGIETGELTIPNIELTAHFLSVSLESLEYPWAIEGLDLTVADQVDHMLDTMLDGLRKR